MKSILLAIGGMADFPGLEPTPLMKADIPSLRVLAADGETGSYLPVEAPFETTPANALLTLMGYDLYKGEISTDRLKRISGLADESELFGEAPSIFIPWFSKRGAVLSPSAEALGIGRLAMLETIGGTDSHDWENLSSVIAEAAIRQCEVKEFVMVYVDWPMQASLAGEPETKKESLEIIDRLLVSPIADYVWHADEVMNLAVTSVYAASWRHRKCIRNNVPAILYYNDRNGLTGLQDNFNELSAIRGNLFLDEPYSLLQELIFA